MEPAGLEQISKESSSPDTERIRRATEQLQTILRDPAALPALFDSSATATDSQIRQFAAVSTRRRSNNRWRRSAPEQRESLKSSVSTASQKETVHSVSVSLAQLSATIFRKEGLQGWPQFMNLLQHSTHSSHSPEKEVGLSSSSVVVSSQPEAFHAHQHESLQLSNETLSDVSFPGVLFYSSRTSTAIARYVRPDDVSLARMLVPKVVTASRTSIPLDGVKACEASEASDEMSETELPIINPHLSEVLTFCSEVAKNVALGEPLRVRVLCCLTFLVKVKSKALLKNRLVPPLSHALFPLMAAEPPMGQSDPEDQDSDDDDLEIGSMGETPKHFAVQVVDMSALHLPPEKLCPHVMPMSEEALRSEDPYQRKAGFSVLAVSSDGAGDHIRQRSSYPSLQIVCKGSDDPSQIVRNAASFASGQFSENLQPHISSYSEEVMPLLLSYSKSVPMGNTHHSAKACYASENFVENLGPKVQPYLPELMECMSQPLKNPSKARTKELAVSAIGAIATAAQDSSSPYFPTIMDLLREFLLTGHEDFHLVQIQSSETSGVLARASGESMKPSAEECCQLGLGLCIHIDDPDVRRCTYSSFAALSGLMGEGLGPYSPQITTLMSSSSRSTEGIVPQYDGISSFSSFDDDSEAEEEEELMDEDMEEEGDDSEISGYSVENAFFDEKEDTCTASGEISMNTCVAFLPFMDATFDEVYKSSECPHMNVRKSAYEASGQFCCASHKASQRSSSDPSSISQTSSARVMPAYMQAVKVERERPVVMAVSESSTGVSRTCGSLASQPPGRLSELCNVLKAVSQKKTACQDAEEDDDEDDDQAEYDAMLLEHAGEAIPVSAATAGGHAFAPFFATFLPLLSCKTKQSCTVAEKSLAVGTSAESIQGLGTASAQFVSRSFPVSLNNAREADPEVRSNAIFGLGVSAEHGGCPAQDHFPKLSGLLLPSSARERHDRVRDNICGALARVSMASPVGKTEPQVSATSLRASPSKEDMEEWLTIGHLFSFSHQNNPEQVVDVASELSRICSSISPDNRIPPDTKAASSSLSTFSAKQHTDSFHTASGSSPNDKAQELQAMMGLT